MSDKAVFCIIDSEVRAERISEELRLAGFSGDDVSVLFPDREGSRDFAHQHQPSAPEARTTAATGGLLGGVLGWIPGIGGIAIPGAGPCIAAGPVIAALRDPTVDAGSGGIAGPLIGLGLPAVAARRYAVRVTDGSILFSVHAATEGERKQAEATFERCGAEDISSTRENGAGDEAIPACA